MEGMNNKIKVLNRVAYGYRNFNNYKNRIILHFNLKPSQIRTIDSKQKQILWPLKASHRTYLKVFQ
ncbi:MAG TPA: transposase [Alloiococcus sp.]|nr:transposase [Alloiococcus sp.]